MLTDARVSAHPMLEPADYDLTPDKAGKILQGDLLAVYQLLWNSALATAMDGPAYREHLIEIILQQSSAVLLQASAKELLDAGWTALLPAEGRASVQPSINTEFPAVIQSALQQCGDFAFNAAGQKVHGYEQCQPLTACFAKPSEWQAWIEEIPAPSFGLDQAIEQMAEHGVGRPATFANRLNAAINSDLIAEQNGKLMVGRYGQQVNECIAKLDSAAKIGADYCAELEHALAAIEKFPKQAGSALRSFTERALGSTPLIADWLDNLNVEGESLDVSLARIAGQFPPADSWSHAALPIGIEPTQSIENISQAITLRSEMDEQFASLETDYWRRISPRQRALHRLAALIIGAGSNPSKVWCKKAGRDLALRWWLDLGPDQRAPSLEELTTLYAKLAAKLPILKLQELYTRLEHVL